MNTDLALVNITWAGQNGDMLEPVARDSSDEQIRVFAAEALKSGSVPGVRADRHADLRHFVVDRFPPTMDAPYSRIFVRPKTPFGATA